MKYKLGEFVRFVEEKREGFITRIIDEQTIAVTDEDGFEIPVLARHVTRVHGQSTIPDQEEEQKPEVLKEFVPFGIYLGITEDQNASNLVHFHLINSSSYTLLFTFTSFKNEIYKAEHHDILSPKSQQKIYSQSLSEIDIWPEFHIQVLRLIASGKELQKPIVFKEKFRAKHFSGPRKNSSLLKQDAWLIELDRPHLKIDPEKLKESFFQSKEEKVLIADPGKVIDLHIQKLRDDPDFLDPAEILNYQLEQFERSLDAAIVHKYQTITFIHGVGNGTLKDKIHKALGKHPQVRTFLDSRKEKFGYGATDVILK